MYDRKTWVIVTLCALGLGANFYFASKNQKDADFIKQAQAAEQAKPAATSTDPAAAPQAGLIVEPPPATVEEQNVTLENEKMVFTFTNLGGGIKNAKFKGEFEVGSKTDHILANKRGGGPIAGFADAAGEDLENVPFTYREDLSTKDKTVVYQAQLPSGLTVRKTFKLVDNKEPGEHYLLDFDLELVNSAAGALNLDRWSLFLGEASPLYQAEASNQTGFFWREGGTMHFKDATSFNGGMFSAAKPLIKSPNDEKIQFAGVANQFFTTVLRAKEPIEGEVWGRSSEINLKKGSKALHSVRAGIRLPSVSINPAEQKNLSYRIFIGPKHNPMLRQMNAKEEGWADVMQYGWYWWVANPLNRLLNGLHSIFDGMSKEWSWGLAVIFVTLIVRGAIWPLHARSTRTMKRMSKLQPEMAKLKEKYPDDPQKLNTEMMGLYRKYGINPIGGCLPMLIQLPIFLGFFRMLQYAVEFRGKEFLWVPDLSQPDVFHTFHLPFELPLLGSEIPINILPIVMGITSFLQIMMTPKTGDKTQQRIIMFMPLIFFFFCYNFASALALYWTTQNIFAIGQTWLMNKIPEPELKARPDSGKKTWVQRMAEKQAELQKNQQAGGGSGAAGMRDVTPAKKRSPRTGG